jgi:hypothetical protein
MSEQAQKPKDSTEFDPAKAFEQIRAESQRQREAAAECARRKREEWEANHRRIAAFGRLCNLLPRLADPTNDPPDIPRLAALMIEYARDIPAGWVEARVERVRQGMARLTAEGKRVHQAELKTILLHLLQAAHAADEAKVTGLFREALRGHAEDVEVFRLELGNWLDDKVVRGWPPLPAELAPDGAPDPQQPDLVAAPHGSEEEGGDGQRPADDTAQAKDYLFGWREILSAVNRKTDDKALVVRLNDQFGGPIQVGGQGERPMADRAKLIAWWNRVEALHADRGDEEAQQDEDREATLSDQYRHGKEGHADTEAPDISGRVKRRRTS